jgi:phosphopantothenate-cysteine ligase
MRINVIITAGGTEEKIDEVRRITNMSTGKLGCMIAEKLNSENINIFYICNKHSLKPKQSNVKIIETTNVDSVKNAINEVLKNDHIHYFIHSMAVSDYTVEGVYDENMIKLDTSSKMKSNNDIVYLKLVRTPKILDLIKKIQPNLKLISFKLLVDVDDNKLYNAAINQLYRSNSDYVIANDLSDIRGGNHRAMIIDSKNVVFVNSKQEIAEYISKIII